MSVYNSSDFDELILAHMIRSPEIFNRVKQLRLIGDDFLTSQEAGIQVYKQIGELLLNLNVCPVPQNILELEINQLVEWGVINSVEPSELEALISWFYTTDLSVEYVDEHLVNFIKHRRFAKIQQEQQNPAELFVKLTEADLSIPKADRAMVFDPFDEPIMCATNAGIQTNFPAVDVSLGGGAHKEECGLLMAASGSGKTAIGVNFAIGAMRDHKVIYLSLEEPVEHLVQRFYSNFFKINYTDLKNGKQEAQELLRKNFREMTNIEKAIYRNLKIIDGRNLCPINYKSIIELLENAAQDGFIADVVIIDQLDFMTSFKQVKKTADRWQEYEQITFEIDDLSNYKLAGTNTISVWLLHQIRGRPQWEYTFDDISGYKGVVKPFDIAIGVGRMPGTEFINLHSLKTRHGEPFAHTYKATFSNMSFVSDTYKPARDGKGLIIPFNEDTEKKRKLKELASKMNNPVAPPENNDEVIVPLGSIRVNNITPP